MSRKGNKRLYQFIDDLVSLCQRELATEFGLADEPARDIALRMAHGICHQYARSTFYVPAVLEIELDERDERIYQAWQQDGPDGARAYTKQRTEQLAQEHNLTPRHLYSVIALARRRDQAKRQPVLPGMESEPT